LAAILVCGTAFIKITIIIVYGITSHRYPYFDIVVELAWSYDPESYVGGSIAAGRAPMPDRSNVMIQTIWDTLAPPRKKLLRSLTIAARWKHLGTDGEQL
jgi:hypothetical protein